MWYRIGLGRGKNDNFKIKTNGTWFLCGRDKEKKGLKFFKNLNLAESYIKHGQGRPERGGSV